MSKPVALRLLDTTVGAGSGLRSRIVERPGLKLTRGVDQHQSQPVATGIEHPRRRLIDEPDPNRLHLFLLAQG